jgi:putative oxidoreductase
MQTWLALAGRVLLSAIFILSGWMKVMDWNGTEAEMAAHHLPMPAVLLAATIVIEIAGGLAILAGWQTPTASLVLFLYLIPVTLTFHDFYNRSGPAMQEQLFHFLKNLAIMGGLLELAAFGAGAWSVDGRLGLARFPAMRAWPRLRRSV